MQIYVRDHVRDHVKKQTNKQKKTRITKHYGYKL